MTTVEKQTLKVGEEIPCCKKDIIRSDITESTGSIKDLITVWYLSGD